MVSRRPILVVDDDSESGVVLAIMLKLGGYATKLGDAFDLLKRYNPGLILLELMMPGMDGRAFRALQLANPDIAHLPVICVSESNDGPELSKALGFADYLRKPVRVSRLMAAVDRWYGADARA